MFTLKSALAAGLLLAPLAMTSAHASGPDEFTLEPIMSGSSTIVYQPDSYTSGTTIMTEPSSTETMIMSEPTATTTDESGFQNVDINDYLVPDSTTNTQ